VITGVDIHPRYQASYRPRARDAFVIVKASEGRTVEYGQARLDHLARARAAGKVVGHYHWLHAGNIAAQVDQFASQPDIRAGDILAVDWEHKVPSVPVTDLNEFVRLLRRRFPQHRIIVYTYACYAPFVKSATAADYADGLWIADYRARSLQLGAPHRCDGQVLPVPWLAWQYTTNGETLDENRIPRFSSAAELRTWARGRIPADTWAKAAGADIWKVAIP
jgi:GH25 family lysozyme M1 (1,4-beta-N-acetylmuramidase)